MYTGVRIEWIEGLDQDPSLSGQMPKQKSNRLNWSISRMERVRRVRPHVVVHTSGPQVSLRPLWPVSVCLCYREENKK